MDRLNIVAHDKFQEIVDAAKEAGSPIRLHSIVIDPEQLAQHTVTVVSQSRLATKLGIEPEERSASTVIAGASIAPTFPDAEEQKVAQIAWEVIRKLENQPAQVPSVAHLANADVQAEIVKAVSERYQPTQLGLEGIAIQPDIASVVARTTALVAQQTIDIPRVLVLPKGEVKSGFKPFTLKLEALQYSAVSEDLWAQYLRTGEMQVLSLDSAGVEQRRPGTMLFLGWWTSTMYLTTITPICSTIWLGRQ